MNVVRKLVFLFVVMLPVVRVSAQADMRAAQSIQFHLADSGLIFTKPPFHNCHAVTIVEVAKDTLLYAWFGGDYEGAKNVAVWGRFRYTKQKEQWGALLTLAQGTDASGSAMPCWNPVLFKSADGHLFLDYKVGPNPREWWAERRISSDHGKTWSPAQRLPSTFFGPIKNKPIQLRNGTIVYPSSVESQEDNRWTIHVEQTNASGNQWRHIPIDCGDYDVIQPSIVQHGGDTLQMLCRSKQNTIAQTWSYDGGNSWSQVHALALPNPNSGIDAVTLHDGWKLLVYNPMQSGKEWWTGRSVLKVAVSKNGRDWKDSVTLEDHRKGEYSYPAVIQDQSNVIRIAYTFDRTTIKYVDLVIPTPSIKH